MDDQGFLKKILLAKEKETEKEFSAALAVYADLNSSALSTHQTAAAAIGEATTLLCLRKPAEAYMVVTDEPCQAAGPLIRGLAENVAAQAAHMLCKYQLALDHVAIALKCAEPGPDGAEEVRHEALARTVFALVELGRLGEAMQVIALVNKTQLEEGLFISFALYRARAEELIGDYRASLTTLDNLKHVAKRSREVEFRRARVLFRLGEYGKSQRHLRKASVLPEDGVTLDSDIEVLQKLLPQPRL